MSAWSPRRAALALVGLAALLLTAGPAVSATSSAARAVEEYRAGHFAAARAIADSLLLVDLSDLRAAWLSARAAEQMEDLSTARCRELELEAVDPRGEIGRLAALHRRALERASADRLAALDRTGTERAIEAGRPRSDQVMLLPLENLGEPESGVGFGFQWTLLLLDRLAGTDLCPISIPELLAAVDLVAIGRVRRATSSIERMPINTVAGLEARLRALPDGEGKGYLNSVSADSSGARREALLAFQRDHGLVPSGDADRETLRALEAALERWIDEPPPTLTPELVPATMRLVGAGLALRGTYALDGDRVRVQYSWVDATGREAVATRARTFARAEAPREAAAAADELLRARSYAVGRAPIPSFPSEEALQALAAGFLLDARGLRELALRRWEGLGETVARWPLAATVRADWDADRAALAPREERLDREWTRAPLVVPGAELDALLDDAMGLRNPNNTDPNSIQLLGTSGQLHIVVEGP